VSAWLAKPVRMAELRDNLLRLLAGAAIPAEKAVPEPSAKKAPAMAAFSSDHRVLLVEDNRVNRMVALGLMKKMGLAADEAQNGQEAVEAVSRKRYDLVLMDVQMPVMDGFDATRRIRELEEESRQNGSGQAPLPIIAMTAHAMQGDRERCLEAGMDDYLAKPISAGALAALLEKWLPGGRPGDEQKR
jgi:CheY-like chemotaxis protein